MKNRNQRVGYTSRGTGEPLLVLSGYAAPARAMDLILQPLVERYTCVTFDYPGSGEARTPILPLTIADLAATAITVLDDLGLDSAHVYGISMGGLVAQEMAIRFPERVRGLILGATTAGGTSAYRRDPRTLVRDLSALQSQFGQVDQDFRSDLPGVRGDPA